MVPADAGDDDGLYQPPRPPLPAPRLHPRPVLSAAPPRPTLSPPPSLTRLAQQQQHHQQQQQQQQHQQQQQQQQQHHQQQQQQLQQQQQQQQQQQAQVTSGSQPPSQGVGGLGSVSSVLACAPQPLPGLAQGPVPHFLTATPLVGLAPRPSAPAPVYRYPPFQPVPQYRPPPNPRVCCRATALSVRP
ncbi:putative uncharacterized protein DDB_G0294196 [Homarus americanus]|uniref:putative uncharacterized protein DDB_G0294196 n=1 Tax=Homarus americanus TaxID=6706 RepID=UPI001C480EE9|nr:putative uncharacterized protein DDB_G0294196 [Homarus americanus]